MDANFNYKFKILPAAFTNMIKANKGRYHHICNA